jgi:hypothetical protein
MDDVQCEIYICEDRMGEWPSWFVRQVGRYGMRSTVPKFPSVALPRCHQKLGSGHTEITICLSCILYIRGHMWFCSPFLSPVADLLRETQARFGTGSAPLRSDPGNKRGERWAAW